MKTNIKDCFSSFQAWERLEKAEHERELAIREELMRYVAMLPTNKLIKECHVFEANCYQRLSNLFEILKRVVIFIQARKTGDACCQI